MILQSTQNQTKTKLYQTDNLQAAILVLSEAFFSLFFFCEVGNLPIFFTLIFF